MRTRSSRSAIAAGLPAAALALLVAASLVAQATDLPVGRSAAGGGAATLDEFSWLAGTWRGDGPNGTTAEIHFLTPRAGVIPSIFRLWKDDRVLILEMATLVQEENGLVMYFRHFTPNLTPLEEEHALTLRFTGRQGDRYMFENVYDENPRRTEITQIGPDAFVSRSELLREDGSTGEIRVEYHRVAPDPVVLHGSDPDE